MKMGSYQRFVKWIGWTLPIKVVFENPVFPANKINISLNCKLSIFTMGVMCTMLFIVCSVYVVCSVWL